MFVKKIVIISIILFSGIFSFSVFAEETATSTPEQADSFSTTTPEIIAPTEETATSTEEIILEPTPNQSSANASDASGQAEETITSFPEPVSQPAESQISEPQPVAQPTSIPTPSFDPATAPSKVTIRVIMPDGTAPPFPVFVTFVGVGNKNYGGKINANGELSVIMPSGRYYTELLVISTEYIQGEDGPSFFLEANEERDFGAIRLMPKSEMASQSLADKTLEEDILAQAESAKGLGKILVLIVKLLLKILEEIRNISSLLSKGGF